MSDNWGTGGARVGQVVCLSKADNASVGHCWMKGRLRGGDMAMAVAHAGDGFWEYQLLEHGFIIGKTKLPGYKLIPGSKFGAYVTGKAAKHQPTRREVGLLLAGEIASFEAETATAPRKSAEQMEATIRLLSDPEDIAAGLSVDELGVKLAERLGAILSLARDGSR